MNSFIIALIIWSDNPMYTLEILYPDYLNKKIMRNSLNGTVLDKYRKKDREFKNTIRTV
jgi:hypothetical protein